MSVKVVVAVGNRKIERCIARMEAIDVLTTVRKREAVLDAVINYNPHAVILSRELSGNRCSARVRPQKWKVVWEPTPYTYRV